MFDKFSNEARRVLEIAAESARRHGQPETGTQHLLVGLASDGQSVAGAALNEAGVTAVALEDLVASGGHDARLLGTLGIDAGQVHATAQRAYGGEPAPSATAPPFSVDATRALGRAVEEAARLRSDRLAAAHLLLGVLDVPGPGTEALAALGVDALQLRRRVLEGVGS
jgi:ATP-dependent Clp protease ATP-binding subunit ClpA